MAFFLASWTRSNGILNAIFGISTILKGYELRSLHAVVVGIGVCVASALPLVLNDLTNFKCFCTPATAGSSMNYRDIEILRKLPKYISRIIVDFFYE